MDKKEEGYVYTWIGECPDIDLEELVRKSKAGNPKPYAGPYAEDIFEEVEEVEVGKETTDLKEMKSDLRSLHVMVEVLLEKIEALEQEASAPSPCRGHRAHGRPGAGDSCTHR